MPLIVAIDGTPLPRRRREAWHRAVQGRTPDRSGPYRPCPARGPPRHPGGRSVHLVLTFRSNSLRWWTAHFASVSVRPHTHRVQSDASPGVPSTDLPSDPLSHPRALVRIQGLGPDIGTRTRDPHLGKAGVPVQRVNSNTPLWTLVHRVSAKSAEYWPVVVRSTRHSRGERDQMSSFWNTKGD